ncbi:hypothetical protein EHP00_758 [Ecytonucleospora hepatopenaei]|uniref:Uncharacterized protein n=1 Tax=Ecytonucleospora hepatopenaei TaxID=646526 RepID=A0A1W0E3C8_9MICR|nr:hypothetical protein EHP00_758 [Ecytonucleospora hepatopenaei]
MKNKKEFHKKLILFVVLLFTLPILTFILAIKANVQPMYALFLSLSIFVCLLIKICLMTIRVYSRRKRNKIQKNK